MKANYFTILWWFLPCASFLTALCSQAVQRERAQTAAGTKACVDACTLSCVQLFASPWTIAHQAPLSRIFQARILEWVTISFSRGSSWPRDQAHISCFGRWILYHCAACTKAERPQKSSAHKVFCLGAQWCVCVSMCVCVSTSVCVTYSEKEGRPRRLHWEGDIWYKTLRKWEGEPDGSLGEEPVSGQRNDPMQRPGGRSGCGRFWAAWRPLWLEYKQ